MNSKQLYLRHKSIYLNASEIQNKINNHNISRENEKKYYKVMNKLNYILSGGADKNSVTYTNMVDKYITKGIPTVRDYSSNATEEEQKERKKELKKKREFFPALEGLMKSPDLNAIQFVKDYKVKLANILAQNDEVVGEEELSGLSSRVSEEVESSRGARLPSSGYRLQSQLQAVSGDIESSRIASIRPSSQSKLTKEEPLRGLSRLPSRGVSQDAIRAQSLPVSSRIASIRPEPPLSDTTSITATDPREYINSVFDIYNHVNNELVQNTKNKEEKIVEITQIENDTETANILKNELNTQINELLSNKTQKENERNKIIESNNQFIKNIKGTTEISGFIDTTTIDLNFLSTKQITEYIEFFEKKIEDLTLANRILMEEVVKLEETRVIAVNAKDKLNIENEELKNVIAQLNIDLDKINKELIALVV